MIYFLAETRERVLARLWSSAAEGGVPHHCAIASPYNKNLTEI